MSPLIETKRNLRLSPFIEAAGVQRDYAQRRRSWRVVSEIRRLKKSGQECCRFIRDADDFVRCLPIEFEIEFGFGTIVVPIAKTLQLASAEAPLYERGARDTDAHARRLTRDPAFFRNRLCRSNDAARNKTWPA